VIWQGLTQRGEGEEKMTTIEEVVKVWDKTHPNNQTETLKGKNVQSGGKIGSGAMHGRLDKWAVIKLADGYPFAKWDDRICYAFDFKSGKSPEINFQRRNGYPCDTEKLYEFLDKNFSGKEINGKKLTLDRGRINPNHLVLKRIFHSDSTAQDICNGMRKFIDLTREKICDFLEGKDKEEAPAESEEKLFTESEKKIFLKIMNKYGIEKNENKNLYGKCEELYIQTLEILDKLYIKRIDTKKVLKVSYYTQKSVAQKLLIASKDENKYGEFRLYYTNGMNDPHEGKTLLQFLEIENEDLELPETLPFIACFSLEVDSLNQFRLYGKDNKEEATGVGIAFDFDFFDNGTNKEQEKYRLYRCVYIDTHEGKISLSFSKKEEEEDEEEEEKEIKYNQSEVEDLFKDLKEKIQDLKEETLKELKINDINKTELAKDLLIRIRYLVKDHAFMEERECRIINMINKEKRSKINIDGERLYINIGGVKNYVDEIYFAPLTEGMEVFEIETGIKCIHSRRPFKSQ
jgi:hypothetical protein